MKLETPEVEKILEFQTEYEHYRQQNEEVKASLPTEWKIKPVGFENASEATFCCLWQISDYFEVRWP